MSFKFHPRALILFEDEDYIFIDKPDGVLSHPNAQSNGTCITPNIYSHQRESFKMGNEELFLLHRLDKETSGVLMLSKKQELANLTKSMFEQHQIKKQYLGLIGGSIRAPIEWSDHIRKDMGRANIDYKQKANALTLVEPLMIFDKPRLTYILMKPQTGRTHQLRIQSSKRSTPIMGDRTYGHFKKNKEVRSSWGLKRMFLHAHTIQFNHPLSKIDIQVTSPLPADLEGVLEKLKNVHAPKI